MHADRAEILEDVNRKMSREEADRQTWQNVLDMLESAWRWTEDHGVDDDNNRVRSSSLTTPLRDSCATQEEMERSFITGREGGYSQDEAIEELKSLLMMDDDVKDAQHQMEKPSLTLPLLVGNQGQD